MRGKNYTQKEWQEMVEMINQGATYQEIAEMTGRPLLSVSSKFRKMGHGINSVRAVNAPAPKEEKKPEVIEVNGKTLIKQKTLDDFTVREMIRNLYDRGCRLKIRNNKPVIVTECIINLADIIA